MRELMAPTKQKTINERNILVMQIVYTRAYNARMSPQPMTEQTPKTKKAVIIGAGPAGLTAALELLRHTDIQPIILEKSRHLGGISRTVQFGENRMDIGGHRFFSKSDKVVSWWLDVLPLEKGSDEHIALSYQNRTHVLERPSSAIHDNDEDVMLVRKRRSRIFYGGKFYEYPVELSWKTLSNLGVVKMLKIGTSYMHSLLFPREEKNLEDFFINRFGYELYLTFFKTYTEKVWGLRCTDLGADWGRQRVKSLSVWKAVQNSILRLFRKANISQKNVETSLIEYFLYPKYGPGHLWEVVARTIEEKGGSIVTNAEVIKIENNNERVRAVTYRDTETGEEHMLEADYFFSTMPITELFAAFTQAPPQEVSAVAQHLTFRDFVTIGVLVEDAELLKLTDNWIYIHDPEVQVGRIQLFRNWSPYMVQSPNAQVLGMEYFCNDTDPLWRMSEEDLGALASKELEHIGLSKHQALAYHVEKVPKAYPVYSGVYKDFDIVKRYLNGIANLYPIGRNGMHRYNNQDHSMLTAMASVESILGNYPKEKVWDINAEEDYHEEK